MSVVCRHWVIQHCLIALGDSGGVSGPSDSGSRSTSGDTGEGEGAVAFQSKGHRLGQ